MRLKKTGDILWVILITLIATVICYAFYSTFSVINDYFGIISAIIVGVLILCEYSGQIAPS